MASNTTTTQKVSLSGSAAALATEVRRSSITTVLSTCPKGPTMYPNSAQERERSVKDWPVLVSPQHVIPHSEQLGHSKIANRQSRSPPLHPSSYGSDKTVINSPSTLGLSDSDCEIFTPRSLSDRITTAENQSTSSPSNSNLVGPEILQPIVIEDTPSVEAPMKKKKKPKKKHNKKKSTSEVTGSPASITANRIELHVTAGEPSSTSQKPSNPAFSCQSPVTTVNSVSVVQDPLLAAASAAMSIHRSEEVRRATGGKIHYLVTSDENASVADVQAEYAAAGREPMSEEYQLAEGETIDDFLPKKLLSQNLQEYLRDNPIPSVKTEEKKKKK
ncbi:hypothetical protein NX059_008362 [Plenodomus lindquistii]|nr:hypothetical protein NX059_008362 [Plenodomus lindquistii]